MLNKRGLSQVITTVLLILIVLAAIIIIWAFISPVITSTGEGVGADCVTIQLQVESCGFTTGIIRRGIGKGDLRNTIVIHPGGTNTQADIAPAELETDTVTFTAGATEIQVAAIVGDQQQICPPTQDPVPCT